MIEPRILSIDQGTSGSKAIVFSPSGEILASFTADYEISYPQPGFVEIDAEALMDSVMAAIRGTLESFESKGGHRSDIRSIGISNQRESFLLWDETGRPLSPVVVWQCRRSSDLCLRMSQDASLVQLVRERTGLVIDPYFSGTKASVLADSDPDLKEHIRRGHALFGTVDTWLAWRLTDGGTFATDRTNASRTMLYDINSLGWDRDLLGRLGLEGLKLPEARPSDAGFGKTDCSGLLAEPIPIGAMIGDSHAAAFGEGLFSPGEAKVTLGTGSSILMNVGEQRADSSSGMVSTICWSAGGRTDYALEGIIVSCGSTINWLRDKLKMIGSSREIDTLAESIDDAGSVYVIPAFSGIGAPWWKLNARAGIIGLDFSHDRRHVARAALESIPFQVADVLNSMAGDAGGKLSAIKADGGITVSDFVMRAIASLTECPVHIPSMKQASAWGAALLAGLNAGLYSGLDEIDKLIGSRETGVTDSIADAKLMGRYRGWRSIMRDY